MPTITVGSLRHSASGLFDHCVLLIVESTGVKEVGERADTQDVTQAIEVMVAEEETRSLFASRTDSEAMPERASGSSRLCPPLVAPVVRCVFRVSPDVHSARRAQAWKEFCTAFTNLPSA